MYDQLAVYAVRADQQNALEAARQLLAILPEAEPKVPGFTFRRFFGSLLRHRHVKLPMSVH
jgi:hypothetical protein